MDAPLRRNRDFMLLQFSQLVSSGGSQITAIAYPLLVLSLTGSSAKAGLVAFARLLPSALFALPAGLAADRWNRRRVMIGAHVTRGVAVGTLGLLIVADEIVFWVIPIVAFVEGVGGAFYHAAQAGALRAVVPQKQLPAAVSVVTGREAMVIVAAPPRRRRALRRGAGAAVPRACDVLCRLDRAAAPHAHALSRGARVR